MAARGIGLILAFVPNHVAYDRLLHGPAEQVHGHLTGDPTYQDHLVRFVENHDEPRAADAFGPRGPVAAVAALTQTGARLIHHGQLTGRRTRLPVFLGRNPDEPTDTTVAGFYRALLGALADPTFHDGRWRLAETTGWPGSAAENLVAWCWDGESRWVVVVNLGDRTATGRVRVPLIDLRERQWRLTDPTHQVSYQRSGHDLVDGLYVELAPRDWHLWRHDPALDPGAGEAGTNGAGVG